VSQKTLDKPIRWRGYIEQVGEKDFFAICLTINVCTRGTSLEEADKSLREAVTLYLDSAVQKGEVSRWVPRHAPLYHYLQYLRIWVRLILSPPPHDAQLISRVVHA
jgi:predicted RNase H-like HicB family nuclease